MICGIGTDVIDVAHITILGRNYSDPFFTKTFTDCERRQATERVDPNRFLASRFAAKEAVFKCFGIDGNKVRLRDIEITSNEKGVPLVHLSGAFLEIAEQKNITKIHLSLSWDGQYALAFAIAEN